MLGCLWTDDTNKVPCSHCDSVAFYAFFLLIMWVPFAMRAGMWAGKGGQGRGWQGWGRHGLGAVGRGGWSGVGRGGPERGMVRGAGWGGWGMHGGTGGAAAWALCLLGFVACSLGPTWSRGVWCLAACAQLMCFLNPLPSSLNPIEQSCLLAGNARYQLLRGRVAYHGGEVLHEGGLGAG